eukprot:GFUD01009980.1.p1 GENE.GFUD01009980.1~~GFUD01009980.1.p1  ORF type:complete len:406 (+),score=68.00 GFUD01009980.1:13-1230(+)
MYSNKSDSTESHYEGDDDVYQDPEDLKITKDKEKPAPLSANDEVYKDPDDFDNSKNRPKPEAPSVDDDNNVYDYIKAPYIVLSQDGREGTKKRSCLIVSILLVIFIACIGVTAIVTYKLTTPNDKTVTKCEEGWLNISSECFKFVDDACQLGCSWEFSIIFCQNLGGKLAEPKTDEVMHILVEHAKTEENLRNKAFWIGLTNFDNDRGFEWASDKSPMDLRKSFWSDSEPSYDGPYVHMKKTTMLLNDRNDINVNKPACQKPAVDQNIQCEEGWDYSKGQCYKFMTKTCKNGCTWLEAAEICLKAGGNLAEGPDFNVLRNIATTKNFTNDWWIGFSDLEKKGTYVRKTDGKFVNLTEYFADGKPDSEDQNCLVMEHSKNFKLSDWNCKFHGVWDKQYQPLCQKIN